jgi:hypothetical protein
MADMQNAKTYFVYVTGQAKRTGRFILAENMEQAKGLFLENRNVKLDQVSAILSKSVKKG